MSLESDDTPPVIRRMLDQFDELLKIVRDSNERIRVAAEAIERQGRRPLN